MTKDEWEKKREKEQREHEDALRFDPRTVREFPYRTGTSFLNDRWSHVYVIYVPGSFAEENKAKPYRLTDGDTNFGQPSWSRDSQYLIGNMARRPEHTDIEYWEDLVRIPARQEKSEVERLISNNYSHVHAQVSPDGRWVAMARELQDRPEFRNSTLAIMSVENGEVVDLTASLDRNLGDFVWSRDSTYLYFTLVKNGAVNLFRVSVVDVASGATRECRG